MIEHNTSNTQDEICNSQPFSLPSSNNSDIVVEENILRKQARPSKFTGQRGHFRSKEEIDPKYQHVFTYQYFNEIQSRVIEDALYSDKSMVVCAPTGSGKTVIFEMAIVQLLMELEDKNYTDDFKIIYMAPVKAVCTERLTEWYPKFTKLGHLCIEVTGDTDVEFPQLKPYRIIITTPEKWDMLTRRWKDHRSLVEVIKLFLIDEVHILNDEIRGPVLEAVVSRMKTIESSVQSTHRIEKLLAQYQDSNVSNASKLNENNNVSVKPVRIRFIAISATVSNPQDVAHWLRTSEKQAVYYKFGDECRPVKLKRIVEGYPCPAGTSIFKFDIVLNYKLWTIIQKYHNGKPTLIFCNTRKSVILTAETLSREITVNFNTEQKNKLMALATTIKNKKIQSLILCGVGCHHAGLLFEERINIERAFRNRDLPILITTTTLAMGVNLPAHLVIVKNTQQYVNGAYQEYSISTILQMVGRAGRPQYDTEATAVIMTRSQDKARYQSLVEGSEPLQSYLHKRLAENLNSEAALGTVCDVAQCVQWLNSTFLSVRAASDPKRYLGLPHGAPAQLISKKIEELCVKAMNGLATAGLISMDEACCIESTEAGRLMSIYYLDLETMKLIMKLEGSESLERLLWLICESHELSDMHLRVDERRCLNSLNRNTAAATIRFPMKGKISSRQMKLNCVIQAVLGCLSIPDPSLNQESMKVMRIADRVCKCLVYYVTRPSFISTNPQFFSTIFNSLILAKCIYARLWENSPYVSRQLKGIGPIFSTLLTSAGKVSFMLLEESHPRDLERIMNKGPPVGNIIRRQVSLLPKYRLTSTPVDEKKVQIQLSLLNHAYLSENMDDLTAGVNHKSYIIAGDTENYLLYLNSFKETDLINVYDGCITFEITRKHSTEHEVVVHCISTTYVGIDEHCKYLFKDMNPFFKSNLQVDHILPNNTLRNVDADDVFKERKRKTIDINVAKCNEKKKRDFKFVEKFNNLKDLFGQTSKDIKLDVEKTTELSNRILRKIEPVKQIGNNITNKELEVAENLNESFENIFAEDFNDDDFVDENKVSDILNEIENEIKSDKTTILDNKQITNYTTLPSYNQKKYNTNTYNFKRKAVATKNNFNFIDKLETSGDTNNDNVYCTDSSKETGFNNAIKGHIEKYLQKAHDYNSTRIDLIELVDKTPNGSPNLDNIQLNNTDVKQITLQKKENELNNDNKIQISPAHILQSEHANILKSIEDDQSNLKVVPYKTCSEKEMISLKSPEPYSGSSNIIVVDDKFAETNIKNEFALVGYPINLQQNNNEPLNNTFIIENDNLEDNPNFENITSHNVKREIYEQETNQIIPLDHTEYEKSHTNTNNTKTNLYIRKYKATQSKLFNITSENEKEKVQMVGELKIDFNVTEIVHKNKSPTTTDTGIDKRHIKHICSIPYTNTSHNKNPLILDSCNNTKQLSNRMLENIDNKPKQQTNEKLNNKSDLPELNKKQNITLPPNNDKAMKENLSIKDILQKYKNNTRRSSKENLHLSEVQVNAQKEVEDATQSVKICRRKLRIGDIDKIHIDLPSTLIDASQNSLINNDSVPKSYQTKERSQLTKNNEYIETYNNIDTNLFHKINFDNDNNIEERSVLTQNNEHLEVDANNIKLVNENEFKEGSLNDMELPSPDLTTELTDDGSEFHINTILNPKALLQSMHVGDEIIPPPLQFCDNNTFSPIHLSPDETKIEDLTEHSEIIHEFDENESVFLDNTDIILTPSTEIDTLTPSRVIISPYSSPGHSLTMMRKKINENTNSLVYPNSRRTKLSHFKFERKSMLRK